MGRWTRRALALGLGTGLGIALVPLLLRGLVHAADGVILGWGHPSEAVRLELGEPAEVRFCYPPRAGMSVSTAWGSDRNDPLVRVEPHGNGLDVEGAYSGHWAERRVLRVEVAADRRSAEFTASFDTDYGLVGGRVRAEDSRAHVHADRVCFDLQVVRLEGRQGTEHWVGALPLDGE